MTKSDMAWRPVAASEAQAGAVLSAKGLLGASTRSKSTTYQRRPAMKSSAEFAPYLACSLAASLHEQRSVVDMLQMATPASRSQQGCTCLSLDCCGCC